MNKPTRILTTAVAGLLIASGAGFAAMTASLNASSTKFDEIASAVGVSIDWDRERLAKCGGDEALGCFRPSAPGVVHLSPDLGDYTRQVLLHEIGHVLQHRLGQPLDECGADLFAASMGSDEGYHCK